MIGRHLGRHLGGTIIASRYVGATTRTRTRGGTIIASRYVGATTRTNLKGSRLYLHCRSLSSFLDRERSIAKEGYNRWLNVPAAFAVQLSIGSVYSWSIFNSPLTKELGVVVQSSGDWGLAGIVPGERNRETFHHPHDS